MNNSYLAVYARRCEQMGRDDSSWCIDHHGLLGEVGGRVRCDDYEKVVPAVRAAKAARSVSPPTAPPDAPPDALPVAPPSQRGTVKNWIDKVSANQLMVAATLLTVGATIYVSRRNR
jgi:hypothetical protein